MPRPRREPCPDLRAGMAGTILPFGAIARTAGPAGKSHADHGEDEARHVGTSGGRDGGIDQVPKRHRDAKLVRNGFAPRDNIGRHVPVIFYWATTSTDRDKNKNPLP